MKTQEELSLVHWAGIKHGGQWIEQYANNIHIYFAKGICSSKNVFVLTFAYGR